MNEDGYKLVKLLTPEALDLESRRMHHCVGHGSYDAGLAAGNHEIYSLRDRKGRPVATVKINRGEIDQIKGKRNASPEARHMAVLKPACEGGQVEGAGRPSGRMPSTSTESSTTSMRSQPGLRSTSSMRRFPTACRLTCRRA
ncbi:PcfJ domain-containing protein [Mesorhizobium sp. M1409]